MDHEWVRNANNNTNEIPKTVIEAIGQFRKTNKFKNVVCYAFRERLHPSQVKAAMESFKQLDKNSDGKVSQDEFKQVMGDSIDGDAAELFAQLDIDGDQFISYDELVSATYGHHVQQEDERLYAQFTALDVNGDGYITEEELETGLKAQIEKMKADGETIHFTLEEAMKAM